MPNRILRESSLGSPSLAALSANGERLFYRLLLVTDDFGRFEADPRVLTGRCFPLHELANTCLQGWYAELEAAGIVGTYHVNGRTYGQFTNWEKFNKPRAKSSKYPVQTSANTCKHMTVYSDSYSYSYSDSDTYSKEDSRAGSDEPAPDGAPPAAPSRDKEVDDVCAYYLTRMGKNPNQYKITASRRRTVARRLKDSDVEALKAAIDECARSDHHMGQNDASKLYNDLERHILKSDAKVEWWLEQRAHRMKEAEDG